MESVKKVIDERAQHKREYDNRMNERHMQLKEGNVDSSKAFDAGLVVTERHVSSTRSENDAHAEDVDIKPVNDSEPMAKTRNNIKPVGKITTVIKPKRWISRGYRVSLNKSFALHEKPNTPRSCLCWKPTGRIFKTAGFRWIPTRKMFTDCTTKVDSEPLNGSNDDITNPYEYDQTLNVSTGLALHRQMASADNTSGVAP
nr:hypothetical protein [Tanacetum cinerariifolium]